MTDTVEENRNKFAHKEMLFAGLEWLKNNTNYLTLNRAIPETMNNAKDTMLAGNSIDVDHFTGPDYVDPEAVEADDNPLGKGDVIIYLNSVIMKGTDNGTVNCVCLLKGTLYAHEIIYMAPITNILVIKEDYPVFLGPWCICNLQPTEVCTVYPDFNSL